MRTRILIALATAATVSTLAEPAQAAGASKSDTTISYVLSVPTAGTHDFLSNVSFLGLGIEGGNYLTDNFNLGVSLRWVRYSQNNGRQTVTTDNGAITGEQQKAINMFPLMAKARYETSQEGTVPYIALGVGALYGQRYNNVGSFSSNQYGWQFGLAPEIGLFQDKLLGQTGAAVAVRYDAGFGTDAMPAYSALSFSIGLREGL